MYWRKVSFHNSASQRHCTERCRLPSHFVPIYTHSSVQWKSYRIVHFITFYLPNAMCINPLKQPERTRYSLFMMPCLQYQGNFPEHAKIRLNFTRKFTSTAATMATGNIHNNWTIPNFWRGGYFFSKVFWRGRSSTWKSLVSAHDGSILWSVTEQGVTEKANNC